jgi:hypothetical protein
MGALSPEIDVEHRNIKIGVLGIRHRRVEVVGESDDFTPEILERLLRPRRR